MARGFLDDDAGRRGAATIRGGVDGGTLTWPDGRTERVGRFVELAAVVARGMTGKARRFDFGTRSVMVPFSQMSAETRNEVKGLNVGAAITLCLTEWFCQREGLI